MIVRTERDSLGEMTLPDVPWGINTQRARENFDLGYSRVDPALIRAVVLVKKAAAQTYLDLGVRPDAYRAVISACDKLLAGECADAFPLDALQGGAGTSINMNVNEVLANLANGAPGVYSPVHPLDDVNRGQSTNDVMPTALRIAAIGMLRDLSDACAKLQESLQKRESEFENIKKLGRTELMDAVPITLGEEFGAYAQAVARDRWRLYKVEERLRQVNLGGTAVGLSDNASRRYRFQVMENLRRLTQMGLAPAEYLMDVTQNNDVFVEASGLLKALAVNLMKISNDIRLMASGPRGGLGELRLRALQQGSTIMPGKVNPVIPEMVIQCAIRAIANDAAVTMAAAHGEFELNAFFPLIADSLLESLRLLTRAADALREKCVDLLDADAEACARHLENSFAFATAYAPRLGYDAVSRAVKEAKSPADARATLERMLKESKQADR